MSMARPRRSHPGKISPATVTSWVEKGWLQPGCDSMSLSGVHLARVQLILELRQDLGVNDEAVPIILDLVDQVYGLRSGLARAMRALQRPGSE